MRLISQLGGGVILLSLHAKETRVSSDEWAIRLDCSMVMGSNPVRPEFFSGPIFKYSFQ